MDYLGEHLLPGQAGHLFIIISFVSSLAAAACYFVSVQNRNRSSGQKWKLLARRFFIVQAISVAAIFALLFYLISNHFFEYKYVWQHSSRSLEMKYLLSCFWEGQEGSFLLWSIWNCLIGLVFIRREKTWEAPVMAVVAMVQLVLATMLLGFDVAGLHIGSNPFILLRNSGVLDNAPAFHDLNGNIRQDYLSFIKDGNDLNPLLQNYWMVIHPPVLFLGFSSTLIPFGFAIAGLWTRKYGEWVKAALPWALFSAGVFALGIMMGAAWAYESLNFGGYWAWDPVENASLVPWLLLVAGIHTMVIYRHTGNALRTSFLFLILCFSLVLYSTYLTRSGDLQDTSVHAFTGEGITKWHLRAFLLIFFLPAIGLYFNRYKEIPHIVKEEETSSREFWMFIGSLVLFLSAVLIISMTSIPIFNKIATLFTSKDKVFTPIAVGEDSAYLYNRIQIFIAVLLGLFTGVGMYLKYRSTRKIFLRKLITPAIVALIAGVALIYFGQIHYTEKTGGYMLAIWLAVMAAVFALVANAGYLWTGIKGNMKKAGGVISHIGFALMLIGILISSSKKEVLSHNTTGIFFNFGKESKEKPGENLTLVQGVRTDMGNYWVTYEKDSVHPEKPLWYYHLRFVSKDGREQFYLTPNAFVNYKGNMGLMANPDAKHYLTHDIFTYITSLPDPDKNKDTSSFKTSTIAVGDTVFYSKGFAVLESVQSFNHIPNVQMGANDSASVARIKVVAKTGSVYTIQPIVIAKDGNSFPQPDTLTAENLVMQLQQVDGNRVDLALKESDALMKYVTLKAYKFPYINVLWLGTLVMVAGFFISMMYRRRVNRLRVVAPPVEKQLETV